MATKRIPWSEADGVGKFMAVVVYAYFTAIGLTLLGAIGAASIGNSALAFTLWGYLPSIFAVGAVIVVVLATILRKLSPDSFLSRDTAK